MTITGYDKNSGTAEVDVAVKAANGGTIMNVTIDGGVTGVNISGTTANAAELLLDNVTIVNSARAINGGSADEAKAMDLTVVNSTLGGKISYIAKVATFTNTAFVVKEGNVKGNVLEPYTTTVLNNCTFEDGFKLSLTDLNTGYAWITGNTVTLKNCYVGDTLITADNVKTLLGIAGGSFTAGELFVGTTQIAP